MYSSRSAHRWWQRNYRQFVKIFLTGCGVFGLTTLVPSYFAINYILMPAMLPMKVAKFMQIEGETFRGGFLTCKAHRWLEKRYGAIYDEERYHKTRPNQYELALPLLCDNCNHIGLDPVFHDDRADICGTNGGQGVMMLFLVKTAPMNYERRKTLRRIWLADRRAAPWLNQIKYVYILGRTMAEQSLPREKVNYYKRLLKSCRGKQRCDDPRDAVEVNELRRKLLSRHENSQEADDTFSYELLIAEALTYDDILFIDSLQDAYHQLAYKSTAALVWAQRYCSKARFVSLVDDDTFVFVDRLMVFLQQYVKTPLFLGGNRIYGEVNRNPFNPKWYISPAIYPRNEIPDYLTGTMYIFGNDTVAAILDKIRHVNITAMGIQIEDMMLAGFARALARIDERHFCNFSTAAHPWATRRTYHIDGDTIAFTSNAKNSRHVARVYEKHFSASFKKPPRFFNIPFY